MVRQIYAIALLGLSMSAGVATIFPLTASAKPTPVEVPITLANGNSALTNLALHLKKINAKMYGAYWCPHCTQQKEMFGNAIKSINYVECDPRGENAKPNLCKIAKVTGYPTWEINGKQYVGVQSLEELAKSSGYKGSTKF